MSLWHNCIQSAAALPGWITVSIPPQGVVLDFVGQRRPAVFGGGSDRDGWRNRMSEQRGRDFKVAPFGGRTDRTAEEAAPADRGPVPSWPSGSGRRKVRAAVTRVREALHRRNCGTVFDK
ncbi:hypothetical protein RW1_055_00700 [Rhodococcus wratislaviensis NBRC 100605]|uniref:Uncharacterized protein n=1 Tax=Rhodococcus wratislaviensis NBRC 100605 TaxID=1219028 RepID=X0PYD7_RHOWR|nr:hypothetical protein RW1_055_00700 [Rhodococcus wratislaviensis NBRC 100605]